MREAFIECMEADGITVESVEIEVGAGRHIESFSWQAKEGEGVVEAIGQACEDMALVQFQVSRT